MYGTAYVPTYYCIRYWWGGMVARLEVPAERPGERESEGAGCEHRLGWGQAGMGAITWS